MSEKSEKLANRSDKNCKFTEWRTPEYVLEMVRLYYGGDIPLDPATNSTNPTRAKLFFTEEDNGLIQPWDTGVFVNPPYGEDLQQWMIKIGTSSNNFNEILALLPTNRWSTKYVHNYFYNENHLKNMVVFDHRVGFVNAAGEAIKNNVYGSILWGFNTDQDKFYECFEPFGTVFRLGVERRNVRTKKKSSRAKQRLASNRAGEREKGY